MALSLEEKKQLAQEFVDYAVTINPNFSARVENESKKTVLVKSFNGDRILVREPKRGCSKRFSTSVSKRLISKFNLMTICVNKTWLVFNREFVYQNIDTDLNVFAFNFFDHYKYNDVKSFMIRVIKNKTGALRLMGHP